MILIQGVDNSTTVVPTHSAASIVASSPTTRSTDTALAAMLGAKTAPAAVASTKSDTSSDSSASSTAAPAPSAQTTVQTTAATASTSSSVTTGRTFTTTPAPASLPTSAPTPPPTPTCPSAIGGSTAGAPGANDAEGVPGTSTADLNSFAAQYNALRVANCLQPIPFANIRYSSCLQQRMWWMADDPSTDSASAWGHTGTAVRSDGVPIVGCDGDLAGGGGYTAASVATAWWNSPDHRASLYAPSFSGSVANVCIAFAMTHGGINVPAPNEPASFVRAAAYWYGC
ncbi:MAG TPA: hypothetical protein VGF80_02535 [Galbitalea sp.]